MVVEKIVKIEEKEVLIPTKKEVSIVLYKCSDGEVFGSESRANIHERYIQVTRFPATFMEDFWDYGKPVEWVFPRNDEDTDIILKNYFCNIGKEWFELNKWHLIVNFPEDNDYFCYPIDKSSFFRYGVLKKELVELTYIKILDTLKDKLK